MRKVKDIACNKLEFWWCQIANIPRLQDCKIDFARTVLSDCQQVKYGGSILTLRVVSEFQTKRKNLGHILHFTSYILHIFTIFQPFYTILHHFPAIFHHFTPIKPVKPAKKCLPEFWSWGNMSSFQTLCDLGTKCPWAFCLSGQNVFWAKCLLALFSSSPSRSGLDFIGNIFHLVTL